MSVELLTPQIPAGYVQWEEQQKAAQSQYQTCYVYLPLHNHPNQYIDKGFIQAGQIEMVIPFAQDALVGEAPPENTHRVKAVAHYEPIAEATETLNDPLTGSEPLVTPNAGISTLAGRASHKLEFFSRPRILAGYIISAQAKWGGRILKTLERMSPIEYRKARLNQYLFTIEQPHPITGKPQRVLLPRVFNVRIAHFQQFAKGNDELIARLAEELIEAEMVAAKMAATYLDDREQERKEGNGANTSQKDQICLTYLNRKWEAEASNEVLRQQEQNQRSQQELMLELQRQSIESNKALAEAMKAIGEKVAQPPIVNVTIPAEALQVAPVETTKKK